MAAVKSKKAPVKKQAGIVLPLDNFWGGRMAVTMGGHDMDVTKVAKALGTTPKKLLKLLEDGRTVDVRWTGVIVSDQK